MIDISRKTKAVTRWANPSDNRPALGVVRFMPDGSAMATNGHGLAILSGANLDPESYPTVNGTSFGSNGVPTNINATDVDATIKAIPKLGKCRIPVLAHALGNLPDVDGKIQIGIAGANVVKTVDNVADVNYPDIGQVCPPADRPSYEIGFTAENMSRAMQSFQDIGANVVRFRFATGEQGHCSPAEMTAVGKDGETLKIILMPARL